MTVREPRQRPRSGHRRELQQVLRRLVVSDVLVVAWACIGAQILRFGGTEVTLGGAGARQFGQVDYSAVTLLLILGWVVALGLNDAYDARIAGHGPEEYKHVLYGSFRFFAVVAILAYVLKLDIARGYVAVAFPVGTVALLLSRKLWRLWLSNHRVHGRLAGSVLVVGDAAHLGGLIQALRSTPAAGYRVVAACCTNGSLTSIDGVPIVGTERDAAAVASRIGVDTVACTSSWQLGARGLRELGWALEGLDIELVVAPGLTDVAGPRVMTRPIAGLPLLHIEAPRFTGPHLAVKTIIDRTAALVGLLLLSPLLLTVAVMIKRDSRGPVFYRQQRIGQGGEPFFMYKFRTMVQDADTKLADVLAEQGQVVEPLYKLQNDPRVTPIGAVLRRFSIDELPQLLNVVIGNMSLVGPRPQVELEVATYADDVRRRLLVKPGMTGLWQVNGRSDLDWDDAVRLDLFYVENWSVVLDLMILLRTMRAVRQASGAY